MSLPPPPPPGGVAPPTPPPNGPNPLNYPTNAPYQQTSYQQPGYPPAYQQPGYPPGAWQPAVQPKRRVNRTVAILAVVTAAVAAVGSVLPWAKAETDFGNATNNVLDVDGKLTIVLALAIGGMFVFSVARGVVWPAITGIPLFALIALIGVIDVADVKNQADNLGDFGGIDINVGIGLWIVLAAGIAGHHPEHRGPDHAVAPHPLTRHGRADTSP